jgi:preprotein translocase subunit SecG
MNGRTELIEYIHRCRQLLHDDAAIAEKLIEAGWDRTMVDFGFVIADKQNAPNLHRRFQLTTLSKISALLVIVFLCSSLILISYANRKPESTKNTATVNTKVATDPAKAKPSTPTQTAPTSTTTVPIQSSSTPAPVPKPTPAAVQPQLTETTGICHSDSTQVPSMASIMLGFDATCEANYGRILTLLNTNSPKPAPHSLIMLTKTQYGVAYAQNGVVYLDQSWFTAHPDDNGAIVHELTHVVQNYTNAPSWLTEGMADYARYELGFATSWSYYHCDSTSRYDSGYSCTATFLKFVQTHYKTTIVHDVHAQLRAQTYTDQFFVTETGKPVSQLYQACLQADCKGGKL